MVLLMGSILWGLRTARATRATLNESAAWPVVTGVIIESRVADRGGVERYCPFVRYAYDLGGTVFHASRIALLPGDSSTCSRTEEAAAHLVATYPVDRRVPVHYDPVEPARSVLEVREPNWLQAFPQSGLIAILVLVVVGIRQLVLVWSKRV
jgi:hypothetical protein